MSSREGRGGFTPEPGTGSASGGHLPPDTQTGASIYDPLNAPLPSELEEERRRTESTRADVIPREHEHEPTEPSPPRRGRGRRRPGFRRVRRTIKYIDPLSVLKLSFVYYVVFLALWLVVVAILYSILESMGLFDTLEDVSEGFALGWDVNITLFFVEKWAFLIGLVLVVVGSLVNVFLAFLYNLGSDLVGGIEMTFVERDL
jgi:hypothetical protein